MVKLVAVKAPLKMTFPVVFVKATVAAFTVEPKVVPPLLVRVRVFKAFAPMAPLVVTAPVVLMVKLEVPADVCSVTVLKLMGVAAPVPTVKVWPSLIVVEPNVI